MRTFNHITTALIDQGDFELLGFDETEPTPFTSLLRDAEIAQVKLNRNPAAADRYALALVDVGLCFDPREA